MLQTQEKITYDFLIEKYRGDLMKAERAEMLEAKWNLPSGVLPHRGIKLAIENYQKKHYG